MAGYNNYNGGGYGGPRNSAPRTNDFPPKQNTNGIRLSNSRAGRFLDVNFWADTTSVTIGSTPPGAPIDWMIIKNAQTTKVNITFSDLSELWDVCEEVMDSLKNTGTFTSSAIRCGKRQDALIEISNGSNIGKTPGIYLVIYMNLDSGNRTNNLEFYPFNDGKVIRSYDHTTGMGKEDIIKIGEFKKFYRAVKEAAKAFTMAQAHTITHLQFNDKLAGFKALAAISASLGVDLGKEVDNIVKGGRSTSGGGGAQRNYNNNNRGYNGNNNRYNNGGYQQPGAFERNQGYSQPTQITASVDDPIDITIPMDGLSNVDMAHLS